MTMSSAIVVPLDEMQQLAGQWRTTITDMDAMVQQIARDIANIPDNAKGLNDVRSRGRNVGSQHRQLFERGLAVHQHVTASVQRFSQADQELAGMVRSQQNVNLVDFIRLNNLGTLGQFPSFGVMTNGAASDLIEQLINFGAGTNLINEIGLTYPKLAKTFAKYTDNLFKLWPTTKKGIEFSSELSTAFGGILDIFSMSKDIYDSKVASSEADAAVARGDYELASKKYNEAHDEALNMFATGTLAIIGIASGYGLVMAGTQVISGVSDWASNVAEKNGWHTTAKVLNVLSDITDLQSHTKKLWDAGINAYHNPHQVLKQATDFVDHTANQIKDAASNMYQNATAWAKSWIW
jgi:hypothetical protein